MNVASTSSSTNRTCLPAPAQKPTTASMRIAFIKGYKAYKEMRSVTDNPYADPRLKEMWNDGFCLAANDSDVEDFEVHH